MADQYADERGPTLDEYAGIDARPEWDHSSPYCDGCAELGMSTCSCEPDGFEETCGECGAENEYCDGLCESCYYADNGPMEDEE